MRDLKSLPNVLSVIAGMVDLTGFLTLGNLFTAHVTGNLAMMAADLVHSEPAKLAQVLIVPAFVAAVGVSWLSARISVQRGASPLRVLLWSQFLLVTVLAAFSLVTLPSVHPGSLNAGIAALIAVCAMGSQFAMLRLTMPHAPSTATMTGNLADSVLALLDALTRTGAPVAGSQDAWKPQALALGGFFLGCMLAGIAVHLLKDGAWLVPMGVSGWTLTTRFQLKSRPADPTSSLDSSASS